MMNDNATNPDRPLVFTIAFGGYAQRFSSCIASQRAYAARHGYRFEVVSRASFSPRGHEAAWLKLMLVRQALTCHPAVAFIDSDCRVSGDAPGFVSCFESGASLCLAPGLSGRVNSGVIFARPGAIDRLTTMIDAMMRQVPEADQAPYENGHVIHYTKDWPGLTLLSKAWNNTTDEALDDHIRHYCGGEGLRRVYRPTLYERVAWSMYQKQDAVKRKLGLKKFSAEPLDRTVDRLLGDVLRRYPVFGDRPQTTPNAEPVPS